MDGVVIFTGKNKNLVGKNCWDKNLEIMFKMNEFLKGLHRLKVSWLSKNTIEWEF